MDAQRLKLKVANNSIVALKESLAVAPTADSLGKKDAIITQKDVEIATKITNIVARDATIGNLNANNYGGKHRGGKGHRNNMQKQY